MAKVRKAHNAILKANPKEKTISLKPIFAALNGELDYGEIKLALVYL